MKAFSSLDLYFLSKELNFLIDERIDTFYLDNDVFYMKIYVRGQGNWFLVNKISKFLYVDKEKHEDSQIPNSFVQHLRKYLGNSFIRKIEAIKGERILKIEIEKKENEDLKTYFLFIEVFANGNIILTDSKLNIMNSLIKKTFKDRSMKVHRKYEFPPKRMLDFFNPDKKALNKELSETDLEIVKFLAIKFGIGGKNAEEICELADIDKKSKNPDSEKLISAILSFLDKELDARILEENGKVIDFFPFEFKTCQNTKKVQTFNEALRLYFSDFLKSVDEKTKRFESELKKLKNRLEKQKIQWGENLQEYERNNAFGNKIYENYALIDELLKGISKGLKEKGKESVLETIENNPELKKLVKKIDFKKQEIILDL
ncbi:MAG: NFACT family protein [Nanoarchaeota archaeon]